MTVKDIEEFVALIDPQARHYETAKDGSDFTVWMEYKAIGLDADDIMAIHGWKFEIARFTRTEYDPMAAAIFAALQNDPRIAVKNYDVEYTAKTGYIEHRFDCEAS